MFNYLSSCTQETLTCNKWLSLLLRNSQVEVIRPYRCLIVQVINYYMLIISVKFLIAIYCFPL